jgi:hypothetical protein
MREYPGGSGGRTHVDFVLDPDDEVLSTVAKSHVLSIDRPQGPERSSKPSTD